MFRFQPYLEKTTYIKVDLDTPLTFPGNNKTQKKRGYKFTAKDRDNFYDWYNAYLRVDFKVPLGRKFIGLFPPNSVAEYRVLFIFPQKTEQQTFHPNIF